MTATRQRHAEPDAVTTWRNGPPKCCHTCEHYGVDGLCVFHFQEPPEAFAATAGECNDWKQETPF